MALALARGQRRRLQAAAAAAAAEAEAAVAAEAEAEAAVEASPESSPDLPRPPPADRVIRTLTRSTESFTVLEVAVRLVGRRGGACVRVPIRRAWAWSVCLGEVQSRLLEASAIGEGAQVTALRAAAPPHARVVRASDLAPGEVLEALLDHHDGGEAAAAAAAEVEAKAVAEAAAVAAATATAAAKAEAKVEAAAAEAAAVAAAAAAAEAEAKAEVTLEAMATTAALLQGEAGPIVEVPDYLAKRDALLVTLEEMGVPGVLARAMCRPKTVFDNWSADGLLSGACPQPRKRFTIDIKGDLIYVYGGCDDEKTATFYDDVWSLDVKAMAWTCVYGVGAVAVPPTRRDAPARAQLQEAAPRRLAAAPRASLVARAVATFITLVAVAAIVQITSGGAAGEAGEHSGAHGVGRSSLQSSLAAGEAARRGVIGTLPAAVAAGSGDGGEGWGGGGDGCGDGGGGGGGDGGGRDGDGSGAAPAAVSLEEGILTGVPSPFGCAWTWPNNCRALDPERATCAYIPGPFPRAEGACLASSLMSHSSSPIVTEFSDDAMFSDDATFSDDGIVNMRYL